MKKQEKNKKASILTFILVFMVIVSFSCVSPVTAAQWTVGEGQDYATIQEAIDNEKTLDGDTINVFSGVYNEDVVVDKNLTIRANGNNIEIKSAKTGFTLINRSNGSTINGFRITSTGTGIKISADNINILGNTITGGKTGINVSNSNTTLLNNIISGQTESGVLGNLTGGFFTFSENKITNLIGCGSVSGISIAVNGSLTSFKAIGNLISNIKAADSAFGIQLGKSKGADGNPVLASVKKLTVTKNTLTSIVANSAVIGIELVTDSVNTLISGNKISKLQGQAAHSVVFGLEAAIVGEGMVVVSKNWVSELTADEQAGGIVAIGMGVLRLEDNFVSNISKAQASLGILGLGMSSKLINNTVSDITSPSVAAGIIGVALGHLDMLFNTGTHVKGGNGAYLIAVGFNSTAVKGNNLESDGTGMGIVICSPNGTINYNRIVNFEYYIQNFMFSSFGPDIDTMLKPIDDAIKKHPELEPILKPIRDDLDKLFHRLENSNTTATYNWYGTNNPDNAKFFIGNGTLNYSPWLVLNIKADPTTIHYSQTSTITADVYRDSAGGYHSADAAWFFSGPKITFTTNLGSVGSKSITVDWFNGLATAILRGDEGPGVAMVTASDYQTALAFVTILGSGPVPWNNTNTVVAMQDTGIPVSTLILAILMVLGGLLVPGKK